MMEQVIHRLEKVDIRLVIGGMVVILALLAFEGWILVLRKPYMEYQQVTSSRQGLASSLDEKSDKSGELTRLATELRQLADRLSGELRLPSADDKMAASLMEALDASAIKHKVNLSGVTPMERRMVSVFEELSFEVGASGAYLPLSDWMLGFGEALGGSATITDFSMKSIDEGRRVQLTLKLALYRPLRSEEKK